MYYPDAFRITDRATLLDFMRRNDFADLIVTSDGRPAVTHLPLLAAESADGSAVIRGHVARANPVWRSFTGVGEALAVFRGPHAYISPEWYETRPAVPTWNYAVVHAYGSPRVVEDPAAVMAMLSDLVDRHESRGDAGARAARPTEFWERLAAGIVAFEMPVSRLEGKFKMSQNRPAADRAGVIAGLERSGDHTDRAVAAMMRELGGRP
jgi:transcriptional regulator